MTRYRVGIKVSSPHQKASKASAYCSHQTTRRAGIGVGQGMLGDGARVRERVGTEDC